MSSIVRKFIVDQYSNPPLPKRTSTLFRFENSPQQHPPQTDHFQELSNQSIIQNYPKTADHARHPIMISCSHCNKLTMTETQNQFGLASTVCCILLMPVLCMGLCCICSDTCKDVKHKCTECRKEVGVNKSQIC